jgi:hypothetical protein
VSHYLPNPAGKRSRKRLAKPCLFAGWKAKGCDGGNDPTLASRSGQQKGSPKSRETHGCPLEAFETRLFWRCLHRRALPWSALLYRVNPGFFEPDFRTIGQLGLARSFEEFGQEVNSFRSDNRRHGGLVRRRLRVRFSGRRLMELVFTQPSDMLVAGKIR